MVIIGLNLVLYLIYKFTYYHQKKNKYYKKSKYLQNIRFPNMHITTNISNTHVYCPVENTIHDMTSDEMSFMLLHHKQKSHKLLQRFDFN